MLFRNYSILDKLDFEYNPVAVKFLLNKPQGIQPFSSSAPICRMLKEAQDKPPFYSGRENFACVDTLVLGFKDPDPVTESGQIGEIERIYQEARANARIYGHIQRIPRDTVRYVAFSSLDKVSFSPDLLILTAAPSQAEILFRALSYSTGKPIISKCTPVLMCGWIFSYPYMTGEMNYVVTGIGYGMKNQKLLPEGLFLISIPYDVIPMLLENLQEMEWVLPINRMSDKERSEYSVRVMSEIRQEYQNR
ncbi:MAG: DUF169 domain-containing protein [Dehalococcoidales bacterium]|nr:MAG: DUF169 domain-containing protein [Dehalococcoidales bacterium]